MIELTACVEGKLREASKLKKRYALMSFSGWPDAGRIASLTAEHFAKSLKAAKILDLDYSEIYDLTVARPVVEIREALISRLSLPAASVYLWKSEEQDASLLIFSGAEPGLRWRQFADGVLKLCGAIAAQRMYLVGGVLDQVPHTRRPRISAVVNMEHLKNEVKLHGLELSDYSGPASIHSYLMIRAGEVGLEAIGVWGHTPTYLTQPDAMVALHVASKIAELMGIRVDLSELKAMAEAQKLNLRKAMIENPDFRRLVEELERQYDSRRAPSYIS